MNTATETPSITAEDRARATKIADNLRKFADDCTEKAAYGDALSFLWQVRASEALGTAILIRGGTPPNDALEHLSDDTLRALAAFRNIAVG